MGKDNKDIKMNNTALARKLFYSGIDGETEVAVRPLKNKDIVTICTVNFDEVVLSQELTPTDLSTIDSVYNFYLSNKTSFTATDLAKSISGNPKKRPSEEMLKEIEDSMRRLMGTTIDINCTAEMQARGLIKDGDSDQVIKSMGGTMIVGSYMKVENKRSGKTEIEYTLMENKMPLPLYDYAERTKQIISVSPVLLDTVSASIGKDTNETVSLKRAIIKRIEIMKNHKNSVTNNKIAFGGLDKNDGIFGEAGILRDDFVKDGDDSSWRVRTAKYRQYIGKLLDYYVSLGYIAGYAWYHNTNVLGGRPSVRGVEIFLDSRTKDDKK